MIKKAVLCTMFAAIVLMISETASALDPIYYPQASYSKTIDYSQWMNTTNEAHTYDFNLDDPLDIGDIGAEDPIASALLQIVFDDDGGTGDGGESASINIDGTGVTGYSGGDTTWSRNVLGSVGDHVLSAIVTRSSGDFWLNDATLSGTYGDNSADPDFLQTKTSGAWLNSDNSSITFSFDLDDTLDVGDVNSEDAINYAMLRLAFGDQGWDFISTEYTQLLIDGDAQFGVNGHEVGPNSATTEIWTALVTPRLLSKHTLEVDVDWISGDFQVNSAGLGGEYTDNPTTPTGGVPEPASMLLFGIGMLGFGVVRRKR